MGDRIPRVCVLEDDDAVRESLSWTLERSGYSVQTFRSPNDFLLSPELDQYDCLIVDVGLPGMTGVELVELLRRRAYSKPAILIAAGSEPRFSDRMHVSTATQFLPKPIEPAILLSAVRKIMGISPLRT